MKKALLFLVALGLVGGGVFFYMIRPVSAPSINKTPISIPEDVVPA